MNGSFAWSTRGLLRDFQRVGQVLSAWISRRQWNFIRSVPGEKAGEFLTRRKLWQLHRRTAGLRTGPGLRRPAGDCPHVVLRLLRKRSLVGKPILDSLGSRVVGGRREAKVAELLVQIVQQASRRRNRLQRVEWIIESPVRGGFLRELCNAERA